LNSHFSTILLVLFLTVNTILAQEQDAPSGRGLVQQLAEAYNHFDYDKSAKLLNIAFNSLDRLSPENRIEIYKYAAFLAFQKGNSSLAANHFWNLLNIDPTYSLDPVTTSPKLLTLFQKTKIEFLQDLNDRLKKLQNRKKKNIPWRALFPGWEQWHRGYSAKGAVLAGAGTAALAGTLYSILATRQKKNAYLSATDPLTIKSLYDEYNDFYKRQYYFAYSLAAVWMLSQVDLTFWSRQNISIKTTASFHRFDGFVVTAYVKF